MDKFSKANSSKTISPALSLDGSSQVSQREELSPLDSILKSDLCRRPKILVIEDDEDQLMFFQTMLNKSGFEIVPSRDAKTGLKILNSQKISAIVSDVCMPIVSGQVFLRSVRQNEQFSTLPVIMISAYANPSLQESLLESSMDHFCPKNRVTADLVRLLRHLIC